MTAPRVLARARQIVDPALRAAVADLPDTVRRIVEYHLGWTDADGTPVPGEGGKRVRAALAVLGAEIVGADDATAAAGAAAVELMHNFTLLHDDIMDGDGTRRHRPTAWRAFGVGPAMLAGDALLVRAVELVQDTATRGAPDAARLLTRTAMALVAGQSADLDGPRDLAGYRVMAAGKTGSLLACALSIGPVLAGAPASRTAALSRAGTQLGCAFQAVDDLLGVWGSPADTGKPARSDLREGKWTLPVLLALDAGTPQAAALRALLTRPARGEDDLRAAADLVAAAGGRDGAEAEAHALVRDARATLSTVPMTPGVRADLTALADYLTRRVA
ncbi:family 2 encapsulin nanocompartment cargo protein polyprenyl transferase [Luedemannella flava]|uniref:Family 2 encapsulin nanocompartment cargo protein polyprenyl transferase n=2 Tax=Luedemannella flava TaxID=349316 RepID=A0ABN2LP48_9ACTN